MEENFSEILVIIPTYNEVDNIKPICARVRQATPQVDILIVDDSSPDGTGELADSLAEQDPHVHVIHRKDKNGLGAAYLAGFRWGLSNYRILIQMDGDGSHHPEQIPRLLKGLDTADMVKGSRYIPGGEVVNWPKSRQLLSRGGSWWIRLMLRLKIRDITGGFNGFHAHTLEAVLDDLSSVGFNFQVDLVWNVVKNNFTIVEVPITFSQREMGQSKMGPGIIVEALLKTTWWGIVDRFHRLTRKPKPAESSDET
ncbi:MAG: polyprenol monophosphomannose synthase [Propionibacteriaceae bacterium]|nr:polyprenol monophosphomannose synthase [Propionibacteriaceae bacterium]